MLSLKDPETGVGLSDETIVDNIITFLFAGHDTTAHSMAFTIYELCKNPEILKKAREEIDVVLAYDKIADASHMGKLEYLEMIVKESLRKHPSAGGTGRVLEEDYDYNGLLLPKGSKIFCSAVTMHNNEKYYPEPEKFIPERHVIFTAIFMNEKNFANGALILGSRKKLLSNDQLAHICRSVVVHETALARTWPWQKN